MKTGKVMHVNGHEVVIDDGDGAPWPCTVANNAAVTINGVKSSRAGIQNGDEIRVYGDSKDINVVEVARDGWKFPDVAKAARSGFDSGKHPTDLEHMTNNELDKFAVDKGVDVSQARSKADKVKVLHDAGH